jgi:hypothetical protein
VTKLDPVAGALATFRHGDRHVVGYVDRMEDLGRGRSVAICMGAIVEAGKDDGAPSRIPIVNRWRVPFTDLTVLAVPCAACGAPAVGNHAMHRDGFCKGPEVEICDACGEEEHPTLDELWSKIAERRRRS